MPVAIDKKKYYMIAEACEMAGTRRNTLLRWIREGRFLDVKIRDRNGWRLFEESDVKRLKAEVNKIKHIKQESNNSQTQSYPKRIFRTD
jgi:predicted site-specific integrase-resolvase